MRFLHKNSDLIFISLITCLFYSFAEAKYGGGSGTVENPYLIYTTEQMNAIGGDRDDWDKHFKLMMDINMSEFNGAPFRIIGNEQTPFTGSFDGNGHVVSNFNYFIGDEEKDHIGLFGYVDCLLIEDLGVINHNIHAEVGDYVGALVGHFGSGTISDCYVHGGNVIGGHYVGGLIGGTKMASMLCYLITLRISNCHANTCVTGTKYIGGMIGFYDGFTAEWAQDFYGISDCYAFSEVWGTESVGGLVGGNFTGQISNCYSSGKVEQDFAIAGGLVGHNYEGTYYEGTTTGSFWDIETSGQSESAGGLGKTTTEMKQQATFTDWDFVEVWDIVENQTYPFLQTEIDN
jgi:hypothetical protein